MTASAVPAALDNLVASLRDAAGLAGVQVLDGLPALVESLEDDCIVVGGETPEVPAVEGQQEPRGLNPRRKGERFSISCAISCWSGDNDPAAVKAVRDRAYALLDVVQDVLAGDVTLRGVLTACRLGSRVVLSQGQTPSGVEASVAFEVSCRAEL